MTVEATISAHRYVESRNTGAVPEGSKTRKDTFCEQWDLLLTHHRDNPWRIASRHEPPVRIFERLRATVRELAIRLSERGFPTRP
jgi:hypothetical protein